MLRPSTVLLASVLLVVRAASAAPPCQRGEPDCCVNDHDCDDDDTCNGIETCEHETRTCLAGAPLANGEACDDGDACTRRDTCQLGQCQGADRVVCTAEDQCHTAGTCDRQTGLCSDPPLTDGTDCDDGNACTRTDTCQQGSCQAGEPVVCTAQDQCHAAGTCNPQTGLCSNPTIADGTDCDDGNACTRTDECQLGICRGSNAVVCTAQDQCHVAGTCNTETGLCSNPAAIEGTTCSDGNACTRNDICQVGICRGGDAVVCTAQDQCHVAGTCNPQTGVCSNPAATDGTDCDDANACTRTDTCQQGTCRGGNPLVCTAQDQCHVVGTCNTQTGLCSNPAATDGTTCSDGNACTHTDTCQQGGCRGGPAVVCTAQDECHVAGTCNPQNGLCSNPAAIDGTTCDDGNACTRTDSCQLGICRGSNAVACPAPDQCHVAGTCNPQTGLCSNPAAADGTTCNDGSACTRTDTCQQGTCRGGNAVVCTAQDQCHAAGTCNAVTGLCSNPPATDGTTCSDGNACTRTDSCQLGICRGSNGVVCTAQDQCHVAGTCNAQTGLCSNPAAIDGTTCNDGSACTRTDSCQLGICRGGNAVVCTAQDQCHVAGTCNAQTGVCSNPAATDGATCNDGNACTRTDSCQLGTCRGGTPLVCTAQDQCHVAGTCNPQTGLCSNPPATDDTTCNDGSACTRTDTCQQGTCRGGNPLVCTAQDQCHVAGTCNAQTGLCSNPAAIDGTTCNDGSACTRSDTCQLGSCRGGNPVVCSAQDQCHVAGTCNAQTGLCSNPAATDGSTCNDGNACTRTDSCQLGVCRGDNPVVCTAQDQCHVAGLCNAQTGTCSNPAAIEGTTCSDGNACTHDDICQVGICRGGEAVVCTAQDQCHVAGTCNTQTGVCSNPAATDGTDCDDANACTRTDSCQLGTCRGGNPLVCTAQDQCHVAGTCNTQTGLCSNPAATDGTTCNDGSACTRADTCQQGSCRGDNPVACTAQDQCHVAGACNAQTGLCSNPAATDGTTCNDGSACTRADTCQQGSCRGDNPVVCTAQDQCHVAGTCNAQTGLCSNPAATDGTTCNDGNACTRTDSCQLGACRGVNPVVCTAQDQCHVAGTCNPLTGACANPAAIDGTDCDDANACTRTDECQLGICRGSNTVVCTAQDQCHVAGTCNPQTGLCANPAATDGTTCNDANACTRTDTCQLGACRGGNPLVCTAQDQCHVAGTCNPQTGACSNPQVADDTGCNDGNACTRTDTCQDGTCTGGNPVVCPEPDQCHDPGTCDPATGLCSDPALVDGTACNDDNACTRVDSCQLGVCTGNDPVICPLPDQCHFPGACDRRTGTCSNPPFTDGTPCDDTDACTRTDTCQTGACTGTDRVICPTPDECHLPTSCDRTTGICPPVTKPDGTPCGDDGVPCTADACATGACDHVPLDGRCDTGECILARCEPGAQEANSIGCTVEAVNEGDVCTDDDYECTDDRCTGGVCRHTTLDARCPSDEPCLPITCDPLRSAPNTTGCVPVPERVNGVECVEDGDPCTGDTCGGGSCTHDPITSKATCDPVGPAYERALALVGEADSLSTLVAGSLPPAARGDALQTTASLNGSAADLASGFERIVRILAGKVEGPLATVKTRGGRVPSSLQTPAQRRGLMALAALQEAPRDVRSFLRGLKPAQRQGLLSRAAVNDFRRRGAGLLRGTKVLKRELKRLQRVSFFTR